jgi:hypothetical protein
MGPIAGGGGEGAGVSANENSCGHGVQINFSDLTPCLTYMIISKKTLWSLCTYATSLDNSVLEYTTMVTFFDKVKNLKPLMDAKFNSKTH